jgi:hypothetical protein
MAGWAPTPLWRGNCLPQQGIKPRSFGRLLRVSVTIFTELLGLTSQQSRLQIKTPLSVMVGGGSPGKPLTACRQRAGGGGGGR